MAIRYLPLCSILLLCAACDRPTPQPRTVDFGAVVVGSSTTRSVTWTVPGTEDLYPMGTTVEGVFGYGLLPDGPFKLDATFTQDFTFAPPDLGSYEGKASLGFGVLVPMAGQLAYSKSSRSLKLKGVGCYAAWSGELELWGMPEVLHPHGSRILNADERMDWKTVELGARVDPMTIRMVSKRTQASTFQLRLVKGDQHFSVVTPAGPVDPTQPHAFSINPIDGGRPLTVRFDPVALGTFSDVVEIFDPQDSTTRAAIALYGRVVAREGEDIPEEDVPGEQPEEPQPGD